MMRLVEADVLEGHSIAVQSTKTPRAVRWVVFGATETARGILTKPKARAVRGGAATARREYSPPTCQRTATQMGVDAGGMRATERRGAGGGA